MGRRWLFGVFALWLSLGTEQAANACSSCGSGGDDPLILYPNEDYKLLVSASDESGLRNIRHDGKESRSFSVIRRQRYVAGFGLLTTRYSFATVVVPFVVNHDQTRTKEGFGDPSLGFRYTFLTQSFDAPWIPQVQWIAGYKPSTSRGTDGARDPFLLDVFGTGFDEWRTGFDVWNGMTPMQFGFSQVWVFPQAKHTAAGKQRGGLKDSSTLTVGYTDTHWKMVTGVSRMRAAKRLTDGELINASEQMQHNFFLTADWKIDLMQMLRFTIVERAAFGRNTNTAKGTAATLTYMRAWQ